MERSRSRHVSVLLPRSPARYGHCRRALPSVNTREHYDRDLPGGLFLLLGKSRYLFGLAVVQPLVLFPSCHRGPDPKAFASHFHRRLRVGDEVVVPSRILGTSPKRGDHDEALAISGVRQGSCERAATLGAGGS